jgi:hypothetical protein
MGCSSDTLPACSSTVRSESSCAMLSVSEPLKKSSLPPGTTARPVVPEAAPVRLNVLVWPSVEVSPSDAVVRSPSSKRPT